MYIVAMTMAAACTPQLGHGEGLPENPPEKYESQEDFLKAAHHVLLEVGVSCSFVYMHL